MSATKRAAELETKLKEMRKYVEEYDGYFLEMCSFYRSRLCDMDHLEGERRDRGKKHAVRTTTVEMMDFKHISDKKTQLENNLDESLKKIHRLSHTLKDLMKGAHDDKMREQMNELMQAMEDRRKDDGLFYLKDDSTVDNSLHLDEEWAEEDAWMTDFMRAFEKQAQEWPGATKGKKGSNASNEEALERCLMHSSHLHRLRQYLRQNDGGLDLFEVRQLRESLQPVVALIKAGSVNALAAELETTGEEVYDEFLELVDFNENDEEDDESSPIHSVTNSALNNQQETIQPENESAAGTKEPQNNGSQVGATLSATVTPLAQSGVGTPKGHVSKSSNKSNKMFLEVLNHLSKQRKMDLFLSDTLANVLTLKKAPKSDAQYEYSTINHGSCVTLVPNELKDAHKTVGANCTIVKACPSEPPSLSCLAPALLEADVNSSGTLALPDDFRGALLMHRLARLKSPNPDSDWVRWTGNRQKEPNASKDVKTKWQPVNFHNLAVVAEARRKDKEKDDAKPVLAQHMMNLQQQQQILHKEKLLKEEKERADKERIEKERVERERLEKEQREKEQKEKDRMEALEKGRRELMERIQELEREKEEAEQKEQERLAKEKLETAERLRAEKEQQQRQQQLDTTQKEELKVVVQESNAVQIESEEVKMEILPGQVLPAIFKAGGVFKAQSNGLTKRVVKHAPPPPVLNASMGMPPSISQEPISLKTRCEFPALSQSALALSMAPPMASSMLAYLPAVPGLLHPRHLSLLSEPALQSYMPETVPVEVESTSTCSPQQDISRITTSAIRHAAARLHPVIAASRIQSFDVFTAPTKLGWTADLAPQFHSASGDHVPHVHSKLSIPFASASMGEEMEVLARDEASGWAWAVSNAVQSVPTCTQNHCPEGWIPTALFSHPPFSYNALLEKAKAKHQQRKAKLQPKIATSTSALKKKK